ncbi:MAG: DNA-binding response regulator [Planctomycetes bacterium HGW-Planctomycetes-1]|nr:MAG: DNA-binding response regulator [Planctomycetes bacterium HGW-Planctomycetes-1]
MILHNVVTVSRESDIHQLVRQVGREVFAADDIKEALDITNRENSDLIIFDHRFNPADIRKFLASSDKKTSPQIVVIGGDEAGKYSGKQFTDAGAHYYLQGKQDYRKLTEIANAIKNNSEKSAKGFFVDDLAASVSMVGRSKAMLETLKMIRLVAESQCNPVLIIGETGTGKELAAKAVHNLRHPNEPFIAVNCAAMTANLLESELFGHVKGSFTSAEREKTGLIELAGAGTIFLDEISEMPMDLQAKLLRVLQEKTFRKVGGTEEISCKATIIASSNRNLSGEVQAKRFRADLFYRLDICPITIAPLRSLHRRDDIPLLAEFFKNTSTVCPQKAEKITSITKLAVDALMEHNWPGNVRELRNIMERAVLLESTEKIGLSSIVIDSANVARSAGGKESEKIKDFSLAKAERQLIARALQETNGQKTKAADLLGISRATLYAKVKQHSLENGDDLQDEVSESSQCQSAAVS